MNKWVSIWGNAVSILENKPAMYAKEITLRYPILIPFDGTSIRFRLDNFAGNETIQIEKVSIAKGSKGTEIDCDTLQAVTFHSQSSFEIKAKENLVSDAVSMQLKKGETVVISFYLKNYTEMRSGVISWGPLSLGYYSLGNQTETRKLDVNNTREINTFYFLNQVDILCDESCRAVICYGDSITAQQWPELLQLKLMEQNQNSAVIRRGVSGSRVLRQYDCLNYDFYGIKGDVRFNHERYADGADTIVILQGINDLIHPVGVEVNPFRPWSDLPTANELIDGLRGFIQKAKELNLKVIMGTIMPVKGWRTYADFRDDLRNEVNQWIRTTDEIDDYIDFDALLKDPKENKQLNPIYDSGDHLHPNQAGHQCMADEVFKHLK